MRIKSLVPTYPSIPTASNTEALPANELRNALVVQNNSAATIAIHVDGLTITSLTPSSSNKIMLIAAGQGYEFPEHMVPTSAITVYQTSGSTIATVLFMEG